jgi:predicted NBD/HSP70 family sugar kinase
MVINKALGNSSLRQHHRGMVLRLVAADVHVRTEIASLTGLSSMGVTRIVTELVDAGLIVEAGKVAGREGPGRQSRRLKINADGAFVFGVTISAFVNELICVDARGRVRAQADLRFHNITNSDGVIVTIVDAIEQMVANHDIPRGRVFGIGAAIAGIVDHATGIVRHASYLGWDGIPFGEALSNRTGLSVVVENLANALNLSEQNYGAARGEQDVLLISGGTTWGASLIQNGTLVRGATSQAGEIGHRYAGQSDLICSCGRNDCLNTVASGWSVLVNSGRISERQFDGKRTNHYARALSKLLEAPKDRQTENLLSTAGEHMARAASDACLHVNPAMVLVVGGLTHSQKFIEGFQREWGQSRLTSISSEVPELVFDPAPPAGSSAHLALDAFVFSAQLALDRITRKSQRKTNG